MTKFKKSDWHRHLYHEATKWRHGVKGQVCWRGLPNASDPNNGSKLKVTDLEAKLKPMLQTCLGEKLVPNEYIQEVTLCMELGKKVETKLIEEAVILRKMLIALKESLILFSHMPKVDQDIIVGKLENLEDIVKNNQMLILVEDDKSQEIPDHPKDFKVIDWMRHTYICCQKWLGNEKGHAHWKNLGVKDPNNSKEGSKMKQEELETCLMELIPQCFEGQLVPKKYVMELKSFMSNGNDRNLKKVLEREQKLRKVAGQLEDIFSRQDFVEVVEKITKVSRTVKEGALLLDKALKKGLLARSAVEEIIMQHEEDGTDAMPEIPEQASAAPIHSPSDSGHISDSSVLSPSSSEVDHSGYTSVDSGIHSDDDLLFNEDEVEKTLEGIDIENLDLKELPDFHNAREVESEDLLEAFRVTTPSKGRKRKSNYDDEAVPKKSRP